MISPPYDPMSQKGAGSLAAWLEQLERERRIVRVTVGGETRFVAAEDAGRYRDALGVSPPEGLPEAFLEAMPDPLEELVARYARTHGPFTAEEVAARFGLGVGPVITALRRLETTGRVVNGAFRPNPQLSTLDSQPAPHTSQPVEWCDSGVLRSLRQKSLSRLRHEVEPVEPAALARFSLVWHEIPGQRQDERGLLETIAQLQGAAIPASILESQVLPARVRDYDPRDLDALIASGQVIWIGLEPIGEKDGRIALFLAEDASQLIVRPTPIAHDPASPDQPAWSIPATPASLPDLIRHHLATRGASFFTSILQSCGDAFYRDVLDALWELVWAGEVTNDTFQPLRALVQPRLRRPRPRPTSWVPRRVPPGSRRSYPDRVQGSGVNTPHSALRIPHTPSPHHPTPPDAAGRWSLVGSVLGPEPSATDRLAARARQLLNRHGILTREMVHAESQAPGGLPGGFSTLYGVLRAMEEAGQIRRGYFVSGCGVLQFALPEAIEPLRAAREPCEPELSSTVLSAADPANPYGAALPWPQRAASICRRPARAAGALVVLIEGALAAWLPPRGERQILTFPIDLPEVSEVTIAKSLANALADLVHDRRHGRRALFIKEVDGLPIQETALAPALAEAGFTFGIHGYMKR